MTRNTLFPTLFLALTLSLVLVVPAVAQQANLAPSTGPGALLDPHEHTRDASWAQLIVRGEVVRAYQSETVSQVTVDDSTATVTRHESYLVVRLTENDNPRLEQRVRISFQNRGRITEAGEIVIRNDDGMFAWLRPGDRVQIVAGLGGLRSGFDEAETRLRLVSAHVID